MPRPVVDKTLEESRRLIAESCELLRSLREEKVSARKAIEECWAAVRLSHFRSKERELLESQDWPDERNE